MKFILVQLALLLLISACSKEVSKSSSAAPPHIPLDATTEEYQSLLAEKGKDVEIDPPVIAKGLKWGGRLSTWIAKMNEGRTEDTAVRLSAPGLQRGIPIDAPSFLSISILENSAKTISQNLPADILAYLEGGEMPATPETFNEDLLKKLRQVYNFYDNSARFKLLAPYLDYYKQAKDRDVRPFYFFLKKKWSVESFETLASLPIEEQKEIGNQLQKLCELRWDVAEGENRKERCVKLLAEASSLNALPEEWELSMQYGAVLWKSFFDIRDEKKYQRQDIIHTDENLLIIPFKRPASNALTDYLKINVEDEFRFKDWKLNIDFTDKASAHLEFQSGVTPHVSGLAGNQIIMDQNEPIEEYSSKWTIRHEFGHVLGLPDCYHEFYDEELGTFVNYQLDVDDLMCSRSGKMNERIKSELQRVYHNPSSVIQ